MRTPTDTLCDAFRYATDKLGLTTKVFHAPGMSATNIRGLINGGRSNPRFVAAVEAIRKLPPDAQAMFVRELFPDLEITGRSKEPDLDLDDDGDVDAADMLRGSVELTAKSTAELQLVTLQPAGEKRHQEVRHVLKELRQRAETVELIDALLRDQAGNRKPAHRPRLAWTGN